MKTMTLPVKSKGKVVTEVEVNLPESLSEAAASIGETAALSAMHYGLKVKGMNAGRASAVGGPRSVVKMIADKLKGDPEAQIRVARELGVDVSQLQDA